VEALWSDPRTEARLLAASAAYTERRRALIQALARRGVPAHGRSGLNVWVPVLEEAAVVAQLAEAGWAVRAGERYRLRSSPAVRITISRLDADDAERVAHEIARALVPARRTHSA
jgi:DNA-binding transcriptional MocR family regulator